VVKEPQEMSLVIQNYPETNWQPLGMRPLQVSVMVTLVLTMVAGILSNPLFTLVNTSVASVPVFNQISQTRTASSAVAMQAPDLEHL
jgi:NAD(P)H-quinone oxidoreductase subunit 2